MSNTTIFTSVINLYLPEPHASLTNGIIFGIPVRGSGDLYEALKRTGLLHIVVLSGINITLLSSIISSVTSRLGKKLSIIITLIVIIGFILFVGPQPPIVRAGIMGVLTALAISYGRVNFSLYALLLSLLLILIFAPIWISSISFQLSYAATLGIILFGSKTVKTSDNFVGKIKEYTGAELKTSLAAQVFTVPLIFIYFKQISLISPLSNIFISWTIAPIMIFGFLAAILGKINILLGLIPSYIVFVLIDYVLFVIKTLSAVPFSYFKF